MENLDDVVLEFQETYDISDSDMITILVEFIARNDLEED